jgi:hypothetical protein
MLKSYHFSSNELALRVCISYHFLEALSDPGELGSLGARYPSSGGECLLLLLARRSFALLVSLSSAQPA